MKLGWTIIFSSLVVAKLVSGDKDSSSDENSPKKVHKNVKQPKSSIHMETHRFGEDYIISTDPKINNIQLQGNYKGIIFLDEFKQQGQPLEVKVFRYNKKFDNKWLTKVEIRVIEPRVNRDPIIFGCSVCRRPNVFINRLKTVVYSDKDVYGILAYRGKPLMSMRFNACTEKQIAGIVRPLEPMTHKRCKEAIKEMKHPGRAKVVNSFGSVLKRLVEKLFGWLMTTNKLKKYPIGNYKPGATTATPATQDATPPAVASPPADTTKT
ncbi:uncharacterized protein LOC129004038 [Macrosteles quadrilineatus]|uniref:uncharacterized protein LOC129004038 n=1 Tax=Macrosteles quadrilineatus TaxID=74068 RepID=UPI0023E346F3|nr:uncharacterized protein LOC129004038 [Macrosteles quadrilineatus]